MFSQIYTVMLPPGQLFSDLILYVYVNSYTWKTPMTSSHSAHLISVESWSTNIFLRAISSTAIKYFFCFLPIHNSCTLYFLSVSALFDNSVIDRCRHYSHSHHCLSWRIIKLICFFLTEKTSKTVRNYQKMLRWAILLVLANWRHCSYPLKKGAAPPCTIVIFFEFS